MSIFVCDVCHRTRESEYYTETSLTTNVINQNFDHICGYCSRERLTVCIYCHEAVLRQFSVLMNENDRVCTHCVSSHDLVMCHECGWYKVSSDMTNESSTLCNQCYSDRYTHCRDCGHLMRRERIVIDGHIFYTVCSDCLNANYPSCYVCGHRSQSSTLTQVDNRPVCQHCINSLPVCDDCNERTLDRNRCEDGLNRCDGCISGNYEYCDQCHTFCEYPHHHIGMRSYSYKPQPIFNGKAEDDLFYGIELECETTGHISCSNMSKILLEKFSDKETLFYIKTDGSLSDGLEVVSHPHTLTKLTKSQWLEDVCQTLLDNKFKSHDTVTCGLHVHMSKNAFLDGIHETKFSYFIYESPYTRQVARRNFNHYCDKINKHLSTNTPDNRSHSRYEAVNFQNQETVEVRVFKGTLKHSTLLVCLLYCDAVFKFTETARISVLSGMNRDTEFIKFIQYKPKYAKLYYYLTNTQSVSQSSNQTY